MNGFWRVEKLHLSLELLRGLVSLHTVHQAHQLGLALSQYLDYGRVGHHDSLLLHVDGLQKTEFQVLGFVECACLVYGVECRVKGQERREFWCVARQ
jgi:hypothetical protein